MGRPDSVHRRHGGACRTVLVVSVRLTREPGENEMKEYAIPFAVAFVAFALGFLAVDYAIMHAQGLTLIYGN